MHALCNGMYVSVSLQSLQPHSVLHSLRSTYNATSDSLLWYSQVVYFIGLAACVLIQESVVSKVYRRLIIKVVYNNNVVMSLSRNKIVRLSCVVVR